MIIGYFVDFYYFFKMWRYVLLVDIFGRDAEFAGCVNVLLTE